MSHTPGPWSMSWELQDYNEFWALYVEAGPATIFVFGNRDEVSPREENRAMADARLIAAAPDLLEALEAALSSQRASDGWREQARAALAKARGEA